MTIILLHLQIKSFTLFPLPSAPPAFTQHLSERSNQMELAEQQRALANQSLVSGNLDSPWEYVCPVAENGSLSQFYVALPQLQVLQWQARLWSQRLPCVWSWAIWQSSWQVPGFSAPNPKGTFCLSWTLSILWTFSGGALVQAGMLSRVEWHSASLLTTLLVVVQGLRHQVFHLRLPHVCPPYLRPLLGPLEGSSIPYLSCGTPSPTLPWILSPVLHPPLDTWYNCALCASAQAPLGTETGDQLVGLVFYLQGIHRHTMSNRKVQFVLWIGGPSARLSGQWLAFPFGYLPQSKGQTERTNDTLEIVLQCMTAQNPVTCTQLPAISFIQCVFLNAASFI